MNFKHPFHLAAIGCAALSLLSGCDKPAAEPVVLSDGTAAHSEPGKATWGASDPSLPSADTAFRPVNEPRVDPSSVRTYPTLTPAQESSAMPVAGQNNDHSAPTGPAKKAGTP
jgi:hypothetical protein